MSTAASKSKMLPDEGLRVVVHAEDLPRRRMLSAMVAEAGHSVVGAQYAADVVLVDGDLPPDGLPTSGIPGAATHRGRSASGFATARLRDYGDHPHRPGTADLAVPNSRPISDLMRAEQARLDPETGAEITTHGTAAQPVSSPPVA